MGAIDDLLVRSLGGASAPEEADEVDILQHHAPRQRSIGGAVQISDLHTHQGRTE
ncbi:hypothetical protein ACWFR5_14120 [Streptomyces sp. NPDC055092]